MSGDLTVFRGVAAFLVFLFVGLWGIILMSLPFMYLEGQAKSTWFAETRGIEMPWYHAMTLDVNIGSADAEVDLETARRRGR